MTTDSSNTETIAVVLLNMGGPENLDQVRPFLYNLFSDRLIIRLGPAFLQKPIAWMIAKKRAPKSQGYYRLIGGGSPLTRITAEQGADLERLLNHTGDFQVTMAMRYWRPFADQTLAELHKKGITKIIALTLYPHYSIATTGSSLHDFRRAIKKYGNFFDTVEIDSWPEQEDYIACLAERIKAGIADHDGETTVVYSAHSLPVKFIQEGDPYVKHLTRTIAAVEAQTGVKGVLCYQSRSGPVEWLQPETGETLAGLAEKGCKRVLMVPLSFVSDHVETLCEIDIQYKEFAAERGMALERIPSLNTDPGFIAGLGKLVENACRKKGWLNENHN